MNPDRCKLKTAKKLLVLHTNFLMKICEVDLFYKKVKRQPCLCGTNKKEGGLLKSSPPIGIREKILSSAR